MRVVLPCSWLFYDVFRRFYDVCRWFYDVLELFNDVFKWFHAVCGWFSGGLVMYANAFMMYSRSIVLSGWCGDRPATGHNVPTQVTATEGHDSVGSGRTRARFIA